ncbi:lipid acyl hydrolase [Niveomyces insectorum RCEF 264]|uniref:Lipid acyl hydrolase n=1 Tax=Niveomyces insectorum RCEF 264 TaxID=1081102 RepID=A0A167USS1_9HYPO|nr:lipid acyl hydrolase [Niveomyces insectorum RCEF 264]
MASTTTLRRKDTTKGPPLRILSLDGGGVRGYSIFIILQEIMHRTFVEIEGRAPHRNEIPKPADHFDLIVGTGTGGLIALMLGRLRLNIETCKELYVRLTRLVFETDKTILGIPTRPTLFKASRLEEAIREAVAQHTVDLDEGKDLSSSAASSGRPGLGAQSSTPRRHASNASVVSFSARSPAAQMARPYFSSQRGDPNALLYDAREYRTKTVVTAMYKGAPRGEDPVMLRSYDSRKEPAPEFDCRIWEAGRATCAIGLAFKPIQIGQSVFHDDGGGTFNPAPYALDEATVNEWPGREVGVFISVGTGKRPAGSDQNNPMWYDGFLGEFAEARRRLIAKIEGCEAVHARMQREHLPKRGVNVENYYRLNVEVGVGEFGMNEWHRLAEISTSTKRYLGRHAERGMVQSAAAKLSKIHRANVRYNRLAEVPEVLRLQQTEPDVAMPLAVELPGDMPTSSMLSPASAADFSPRQSYDSGFDQLTVSPAHNNNNIHHHHHNHNTTPSPRSSSDRVAHTTAGSTLSPSADPILSSSPPRMPPYPVQQPPSSAPAGTGTGSTPARTAATGGRSSTRPLSTGGVPPSAAAGDEDRLLVAAPTPEQWRNAATGAPQPHRIEPPPLPPKTPLPEGNGRPSFSSPASRRPIGGPPYPVDDDEVPPPPVNKARKPDYRGR